MGMCAMNICLKLGPTLHWSSIHYELLVTLMTALLVLDSQLVQLVYLVMDVEVCVGAEMSQNVTP